MPLYLETTWRPLVQTCFPTGFWCVPSLHSQNRTTATKESVILRMSMVNSTIFSPNSLWCVCRSWVHWTPLGTFPNCVNINHIFKRAPWWGFYFSITNCSPENDFQIFLIVPERQRWHRWLNPTSKRSKMFTWLGIPLTSANFGCHTLVYPSYCKQHVAFTNANS